MTEPTVINGMRQPVAGQPTEIVERKGIGHPDTICDAVMERVAVELSQAYFKAFRRVLHFNADKAMLVAGRVAYLFDNPQTALPLLAAGRTRALAVTTAERLPDLPDVPTLSETVQPGLVVTSWHGIIARSGTPEPVLDRLATEIHKELIKTAPQLQRYA